MQTAQAGRQAGKEAALRAQVVQAARKAAAAGEEKDAEPQPQPSHERIRSRKVNHATVEGETQGEKM